MKKLLLSLFLASTFLSFSQQYFPLWHKQWAGTQFLQTLYEIDKQGNHIISGDLNGTYDFDPGTSTFNLTSTSGKVGGSIMKLDSNGTFLWAKLFSAPNDINITKMSLDAVGNVYLVIQYLYSGSIDVDPGPGTIAVSISAAAPENVLVSLDRNGNYRFHRRFAFGASALYFNHMKVDRNNRIFIYASNMNNTIDIDPGSSVVSMPTGNFYVKYDTLGNYIWSKGLGFNPSFPGISKLDFDYKNNVIIQGAYDNTTDFDYGTATFSLLTPTFSTPNHWFVMKTDSQMNFIWATGFHSKNSTQLLKTLIDTANNIFICGNTSASKFYPKYNDTTYSRVAVGSWNPYIIKFNGVNGNYINDFYLNRPNPTDFGVAIDGKIFITGTFAGTADFDQSASTFNLTGGVLGDAFMAVYDNNFNFFRAYGYTNFPAPDDHQSGLFIRPWHNTVYLYALQNKNVNYGAGSFSYVINSTYAKVLIKFNLQSVSLGIEEESSSIFSLYPNPSSSQTTIRINRNITNANLSVYNCLGQVVKEIKNISGDSIILLRDNLVSGMYFLKLTENDKVIMTNKLLIVD